MNVKDTEKYNKMVKWLKRKINAKSEAEVFKYVVDRVCKEMGYYQDKSKENVNSLGLSRTQFKNYVKSWKEKQELPI